MSTPSISSPSPAREAPKGPTMLARAAGTPSSENEFLPTAEWNENPGSEVVSSQPKNPAVLVVPGSTASTFPSDPNENALDIGLVSSAVVPVVFGSEASENDRDDCSATTPGTTPATTGGSTPAPTPEACPRDGRAGGASGTGHAGAPLDSTPATTGESSPESTPEALRLLALVGTDEDPYQDGGPWAYANEPGGRVFMVTQNFEHPSTGQSLITTEQVEKAVCKKGVKRFAWITHGKDVYTAEEARKNPALVQGAHKAAHVHAVIQRTSFASIAQVARAFGVPPQCVEPKPPSAFLDLVEYLTHEHPSQRDKGKHRYDDSEVHASKGWDWRADLEEHKVARQEKGLGKALRRRRDEAALRVSIGEWSLAFVREHDRPLWVAPGVMNHLKALRADFLTSQTPPGQVINFYVCGEGGVGKDLLAAALARSLNPNAEQPYFTIGGDNVSFEHYDGEEIVIWEDMRAYSMLSTCRNDRGLLFRVLGPYRDASKKVIVNIKGSDTQLLNRVNIVTGPDDYQTFLNGLAGKYETYSKESGAKIRRTSENKAQAYRRFPVIIPVTEGEFSIYVNKGFLEGTREYFQYESYEHLRQNLELVKRRCERIEDLARGEQVYRQIEAKTVVPVVEQHRRLVGDALEPLEADEVLAEFSNAGQPVIAPEPTPEEIEAREKAEASAQMWAVAHQVLSVIESNQRAAEHKAAEDRRKANELARKQREQEVLTAKKTELAAAGQLDLIPKVRIEYIGGEPRATLPRPKSQWNI